MLINVITREIASFEQMKQMTLGQSNIYCGCQQILFLFPFPTPDYYYTAEPPRSSDTDKPLDLDTALREETQMRARIVHPETSSLSWPNTSASTIKL